VRSTIRPLFVAIASLALALGVFAPSMAWAQSATVCVPAVSMEPRGPGDDRPRQPLRPGRYVLRIDGRVLLTVHRDRAARVEGLAPGVHTVELLIDGHRVATIRPRLRVGQVLGLRPDDYDGPQLAPARC